MYPNTKPIEAPLTDWEWSQLKDWDIEGQYDPLDDDDE